MLYPRPDKPVDRVLAALLSHVDRVASELKLAYFVGGAFARDLILVHVHGFDVPRPTRDVDIGIAVRNWDDFEQVNERLTRGGEFSPVHGVVHRLMFRASQNVAGIPLDILPFSGVEEPGSVLRWPPDRTVVMKVTGFDEALARAEIVQISSTLVVPVASLAGQALLKLAAWLDRGAATPRDAVDLSIILRRYGDSGNVDRLYEENPELLEAADFDVERAGAVLLGQDARAIASAKSYGRLSSAFTPDMREKLLIHVSRGTQIAEDDRVARAKALIDAFFSGFSDGTRS
jgi:predicted nucleotidyltransferase